jgi:hypothetical protein
LLRICGNSHSAPANLNFEKDATVPREAHYFSARDAQKMAVTRSSSAKKVVRKAVAVKVTQSSGGKRVSWDDRYNQLFALRNRKDIVALIGAPRWESGVIISEQNSRPLSRIVTVFFISTRSKSYQNLAFSSVFVIKSRRRI